MVILIQRSRIKGRSCGPFVRVRAHQSDLLPALMAMDLTLLTWGWLDDTELLLCDELSLLMEGRLAILLLQTNQLILLAYHFFLQCF